MLTFYHLLNCLLLVQEPLTEVLISSCHFASGKEKQRYFISYARVSAISQAALLLGRPQAHV